MNKKLLTGALIGLGMFVASKYTAQNVLESKMADHYNNWVENCAFDSSCELDKEERDSLVRKIANGYGILDAEVKYRRFRDETEIAPDGFATPKTIYKLLTN